MSEKLKPKVVISILPCINSALIGLCKNNGEPQIAEVKPPKEMTWLQKQLNKKIRGTGKRRR